VIRYRFDNQDATIDDFLARQRVMSLLVIKDGQILVERYQYDRIAEHRFMSHSMAKSITALAVGYALAEGRIKSLDDTVETYAKKLAGTAYGRARIRDILRMASGVPFTEVYDGNDDNFRYSLLRSQKGLIEALRVFGNRTAVAPGTRFHYASIETQVLGALVQAVTGETLSRYLATGLWQPLGAEADAAWNIVDVDKFESASGGFNAILRDYGRLGMLLANDGGLSTLPFGSDSWQSAVQMALRTQNPCI
jgi:CubicO group peptidase (beta-lactamase class C family)